MKHFLLLALLVTILFSCSSDTEDIVQKNSGIITTTLAEKSAAATAATLSCFKIEARYTLDVSNGLNNPVINFISIPPAGVSAINGYKVRVEVQSLADCEDLNSGTGTITAYTTGSTYYSVNSFPPTISVSPVGFPPCYRWRMVYESTAKTACTCYTAWYDCPVM